ncbi:MAG: hypothetical protein IPJ40_16845 [Saprospirales bacterium]|nr:hypothetical protein [Saprospirales bacterium]
MDNTKWIKPIGIFLILFGVLGFINAFSGFIVLTVASMNEDSKVPAAILQWLGPLSGLGVLVYALYALAGSFLLARKPFALKWIYGALIASILYKILPLFFLSPYSQPPAFNYGFNWPNFIRPTVDLLFLLGVWRIFRQEALPPKPKQEELVESLTSAPELRFSERQLKSLSIVGLVCLLVPISIFGLWVYVSSLGKPQAE